MSTVVERALALWGLAGADHCLVAARENAVYRVTAGGRSHALRLHRQGYRSDRELWSELVWMDAVARGGIRVPAPIPSTTGDMLHLVDDVQVDMLTWLPGGTVAEALGQANSQERVAIFSRIGREMARLHEISDAWEPPQDFWRCAWDREGLLGDAPLWDRFWDNPALDESDHAMFAAFRVAADTALAQRQADLDYGLIHADLVSANVMIDNGRLQLIDFDDGGFGFRLFDIATALVKHMAAPDYPALQEGLLAGYMSVRPVSLDLLDLFLALRAASYVGWNISRMAEDGGVARNARFITDARHLIQVYLNSYG